MKGAEFLDVVALLVAVEGYVFRNACLLVAVRRVVAFGRVLSRGPCLRRNPGRPL